MIRTAMLVRHTKRRLREEARDAIRGVAAVPGVGHEIQPQLVPLAQVDVQRALPPVS